MTIVEEGVSSVYAAPGQRGAVANYRPRYGHYIGGEFVEPIKGGYFENISPVNGKPFVEWPGGWRGDMRKRYWGFDAGRYRTAVLRSRSGCRTL